MTAPLLSLGALALFAAAAVPAAHVVSQDEAIPADTEIQTTESGLQYSVLQDGDGKTFPGPGDKVKVHYRGWLKEGGKEFDSSFKRGVPAEFGVGAVIKGWTEGLQLMSVGSKFKFTIPSALGYGPNGSGASIPPNADLIFMVELLEITGRSLPYVAWDDARETVKTESGLEYQVLAAGDGAPSKGADSVLVEYVMFENDGTFVTGSGAQGPISGPPSRINVPFISEAFDFMKAGDHILFRVPKGMGLNRGPSAAEEPTLWQLQLVSAVTFEKPEFVLPPDAELQTTASGLKYKVLTEGTGNTPTTASTVEVHYSGWLTNGNGFDSSYERGTPAQFGVTQVIAGWTEGLQLMKEGGKYIFVIPYNLAYGENGRPPSIPAKSDLVFVVELLSIKS